MAAVLIVGLLAVAAIMGANLPIVGVVAVAAIGTTRPEILRRTSAMLSLSVRGRQSVMLGRPALVGIALVGILLRLRAFLVDRALWLDEAALARSFLERDLLQLLGFPLMEDQSAPPGFILVVHALVRTFGFDETTLRILPLLASIAAVALALILAEGALRTRSGRALFVSLVALSPFLVYYAQEHKQYSLDALAALALLVVRDRKWIDRHPLRTGLLLATVAFLSLPGAVLVGVLVGLRVVESTTRDELLRVVRPGLLAALGIGAHLAYTLRAGTDRERMVRIWTNADAFPPDAGLAEQLVWLAGKTLEISWVGLAHGDIGGSRVQVVEPLLVLPFVALVLVALRRLGPTARFAAVAALTAVLLAQLTLYPIASRLSLHLVPMLAFLAAVGFERVVRRLRTVERSSSLRTFLAAAVLLLPVSTSIDRLVSPRDTMDIRRAVATVEREHRAGDVVISNEYSRLAWDVYVESGLLAPDFRVDWDAHPGGTPETITALLTGYAPLGVEREALPRRFWFFAPHRASELQAAMRAAASAAQLTTVCDVIADGLFVGMLSEEEEESDAALCGAS